jgi:hypothetical protein
MDKLRILIFLLEFLQIWFDEMTFIFLGGNKTFA